MFARAFELVTSTALATRGLKAETVETAGGWTLKCWRGGNPAGEPWVLLHGLGATAATYLPLLQQLHSDCDLLLPELSTLGGSRGPEPALGIPQATRALAELIEKRFAGRPVTLCGISLGGWIAVRLALARPDLVARLLLVVPGGYRNQDWERIGRMVRVETYRDSAAIWRALFARPPLLLRPGRPLLYLAYRSSAVKAALATLHEEDAFGDEELAELGKAERKVEGESGTRQLPVGLIWGAEDRLFLREAGERMASAIPASRFVAIERAGHGVQWERPREFLAAVESLRRALPLS